MKSTLVCAFLSAFAVSTVIFWAVSHFGFLLVKGRGRIPFFLLCSSSHVAWCESVLFDAIWVNGVSWVLGGYLETLKRFVGSLGGRRILHPPQLLQEQPCISVHFMYWDSLHKKEKKVWKTAVLDNPQGRLFTFQWLRKGWNLKPIGNQATEKYFSWKNFKTTKGYKKGLTVHFMAGGEQYH